MQSQQPAADDHESTEVVVRLALAAHELKTPLVAIIGYADLLGAPYNDLSDDEARAAALAIATMGRRLAASVNDLLDAGSFAAPARRELVDFDLLITDCIDSAPPPAGVTVTKDVGIDVGPRRVWSDETRLLRVVVNFLTNAYRYGGPEVTIRVHSAPGAIEVDVEDDGPGVPATLVPHMFDFFVRGSHRRNGTEAGGSGLGLALAVQAAQSVGATIGYSEVAPHGSLFTMSIPTRNGDDQER